MKLYSLTVRRFTRKEKTPMNTIPNVLALMILSLLCVAPIVLRYHLIGGKPGSAVVYTVAFVLFVNLAMGTYYSVAGLVSYAKIGCNSFIAASLEKEIIKEGTAEWQESMSNTINFTQMIANGLKGGIDKEREVMQQSGASEKFISGVLTQDIVQWRHQVLLHNNAVRQFNTAKMRFAQGSQYRGAEKILLHEINATF